MRLMNKMLYTVFAFQLFLIIVYATFSTLWQLQHKNEVYLQIDGLETNIAVSWILSLLTYWVAYSHMIPISLYVIIEVLKMTQVSNSLTNPMYRHIL